MPAVYRIQHLPTGMYFCPSREIRVKLPDLPSYYGGDGLYVKSNLSKTGKTYLKRPSIKQIGKYYYTHLVQSFKEIDPSGPYQMLPVVAEEWVIEEVA